LGEGSYGSVWKAIHNASQIECAIKVVDMEDEDVDELVKEVDIMRRLDGKFIIQ
jgi:serine/threonine protein kinase